jgi:hypothetical protein
MDLARREEYKQRLYELTPADGKSVGNVSLRELLSTAFPDETFTRDDYFELRNSLRTDGKFETGRGRGGSVHRLLSSAVEPTELAVGLAPTTTEAVGPAETIPEQREADLYGPFKTAVESGYVPDNDLKPWICEITAAQGRRNTGGRWTRPDLALVAQQTFPYVPNKIFQVVTFEIKPDISTALDGVFEAAAHTAFAHKSYLAFPDSDDYSGSPLYDRIYLECERFGLGLILFGDVNNWDTYDFQVPAKFREPDPQAVNDFIKTQISERSREEIQRWFR